MGVDLKAYTARAMELETAIYTQKKLMNTHETIIAEQRPQKPIKREIEYPQKPQVPAPSTKETDVRLNLLFFGGLALAILCLCFDMVAFGIVMLIIDGLVGIGVFVERSDKKQADEWARIRQQNYQKELAEYPKQLEQYKKDVQLAEASYKASMERYESDICRYYSDSESVMSQHSSSLASLEAALQALYDENIIFPKYRNMVAITTINEYLMSGRCYELEGPNGAYNMYEMELRQNINIGQLSTNVDNLEQIRNNQ